MLVVPCPRCKQRFAIPEESGAEWKKCGGCGADFFVPRQMESGGGQVKLAVETKDPPIKSAKPKAQKKFRVVRPKRLWESPLFWLGLGLGVVALVVSAIYTQPRRFPTEVVCGKVQEKLFPSGKADGRERIYLSTNYIKQEPVGGSKFSYTIYSSGEWRVRTWDEAHSLLPSSVWFDGEKHWLQSERGRISPADTSTVSDRALRTHLVTGTWCLPSPRIKLTYLPEKSTAEVHAIRVSTAGGSHGTVYVNRLDSLPTKISIQRHQTQFKKYHPTPDGAVVDELETRFFGELVAESKLDQIGKTARPSFVRTGLQPPPVVVKTEEKVAPVSCSFDSAIANDLEGGYPRYRIENQMDVYCGSPRRERRPDAWPQWHRLFGTEMCGLIGVDALKNFTVAFDLAIQRIGIIDRAGALGALEGDSDE